MGGADGAISAWVADECNRILGQELSPGEEELHADLAEGGKLREPESWEKFDVFSPREACEVRKQITQTRRVLTWGMADGKKCVIARLVAKGCQEPDLEDGLVDTLGCVSLRSPHLQVVPLSAIRRWKLWGLEIKNAFSQAGG